MSSPLAKTSKTAIDAALIAVHQRTSHGTRVQLLAKLLVSRIAELFSSGPVRALDVGCGDMSLSVAVEEALPTVVWKCVDIHPCPESKLVEDARWHRYQIFDGKTLPFAAGQFDVVTFVDVLHHVPEELRIDLLRSAAATGKKVIIKDHFEYGMYSRSALRIMDFVGNFGYGINIPKRYFRIASFHRLCESAGLKVVRCDIGIRLYDHLPVLRHLLFSKWQFIAICERVT